MTIANPFPSTNVGTIPRNAPQMPVYHEGTHRRTYWTGAGYPGTVIVFCYDHDTEAYSSHTFSGQTGYSNLDDHNNGTLYVRSDGRLMCFWTYHGSTTNLYYSMTTNPEDISSWGAIQTYNSAADWGGTTDGKLTYVQAIHLSSTGRTYIFGRVQAVGWACVCYSDDEFATAPVSGKPICAYYTFVASDGVDTIHFNTNPYAGAVRGEVGYFKMVGEEFTKADGTHICYWDDLDRSNLETRIDHEASDIIYSDSVYPGVHLAAGTDEVGNPVVPFFTYTAADPLTDNLLKCARWNGTAWDIVDVCNLGRGWCPTEASWTAGGTPDTTTMRRLFVSREQTSGGGEWEIESWYTSDWQTWALEREITKADTSLPLKVWRPMPTYGGGPLQLIFTGGTRTFYTTYDTRLYTYLGEPFPVLTATAGTDHIALTSSIPFTIVERRVGG